jgi:hypothetical protein
MSNFNEIGSQLNTTTSKTNSALFRVYIVINSELVSFVLSHYTMDDIISYW